MEFMEFKGKTKDEALMRPALSLALPALNWSTK